MTRCGQCGADQPADAGCQACFDAFLAYEAERPTVFAAVHHLTVATYFLQHPAGYRWDVVTMWYDIIADTLDGAATPAEIRHRMGRQFAGSVSVRDAAASLPREWPNAWSATVQSLLDPRDELPSPEEYIARAHRWGAAARATVDATGAYRRPTA